MAALVATSLTAFAQGLPAQSQGITHDAPPCIVERGDCSLAAGDTLDAMYMVSVRRIEEAVEKVLARETTPGVTIAYDACAEVNARYEPERSRIVLCEGLYRSVLAEMRSGLRNIPEWNNFDAHWTFSLKVMEFMILHELAHALIHHWTLPVVGNEEVAADQFAAWLAVLTGKRDLIPFAQIVYRQWSVPGRISETLGLTQREFGQIHPHLKDRSLNLACWSIGITGGALDEDELPPERHRQCKDEWLKADSAWMDMMLKYLRWDG
jgi:hypothetical protein